MAESRRFLGCEFLLSSQRLQYERRTGVLPGRSKIWLTKYLDALLIAVLFFFFFAFDTFRHHLKHVVLPFHSLFSCGGGKCAKPVEEFMHSTGLRNTCEVFLSIEFLNISTFATILQTETSVCISQPGRTLDQVTCCGLF